MSTFKICSSLSKYDIGTILMPDYSRNYTCSFGIYEILLVVYSEATSSFWNSSSSSYYSVASIFSFMSPTIGSVRIPYIGLLLSDTSIKWYLAVKSLGSNTLFAKSSSVVSELSLSFIEELLFWKKSSSLKNVWF